MSIRRAFRRATSRLLARPAAAKSVVSARRPSPWRVPPYNDGTHEDYLARLPAGAATMTNDLVSRIMTPAGPGAPRRHHYIPQFFLRRFAEGDQLVMVDLENPTKRVLSHVTNLAVFKDFYTIDADGIGETPAVENLFAHIDGEAVEPLVRLSYGVWFPPQLYDRVWLSLWILLLHLRGPRARRTQEALTDYAWKLLAFSRSKETPDTSPAEAVALLNDLRCEEHQNEHIRRMLTMCHPAVARMLAERHWSLVKFSTPGLILPDSPVVLLSSTPGPSVGIGSADEIVLPVDRRTVLCLSREQPQGGPITRDPPQTSIEQLNQLFAQRATSQVFFHPDDEERLRHITLPSPRSEPLIHVAFPPDAGELALLRADGVNAPPQRVAPKRYPRSAL